MSYNVLVIPEDPTYNGYILKPLVSRILEECGKPNAKVTVLTNPRATGYVHAKSLIEKALLVRYSHMNLLLFLPDADGADKSAALTALEDVAEQKGVELICIAAVQEIEVWLLAGHTDKLDVQWQDLRADPDVKENIFEPFLREHGDARRAGGGRDLLMQETLGNYQGLLARCPELRTLQNRVCASTAHANNDQ
ncbi:MAG TPA: hypothetical protein VNX88_25200 [Terriglobales bacterium]|nr:hypothetical protein [Terriglobales bacterium]